jgi:hypothetical protein
MKNKNYYTILIIEKESIKENSNNKKEKNIKTDNKNEKNLNKNFNLFI